MSEVKQVKVDNWGIYFLQRLKHFFNRTDYCDLTLQFQDNAQLKVHRLVLNACTEYFELLERTCEMYEDCLVMPEDLQADVVVPIVNFMYTGQLEFRMDALERLYQTSLIMNMPVLSKLLEAHRGPQGKNSSQNYNSLRKYPKVADTPRNSKHSAPTPSSSGKRSYTKAFESNNSTPKASERRASTMKTVEKIAVTQEAIVYRDKKLYLPLNKQSPKSSDRLPSPIPLDSSLYNKKLVLGEPRPTRYELPEELDNDNVFDNSFTNISYTSKPLMVHPDTTKQYSSKKGINAFNEPTSSKKPYATTVDIVECKKISKNDNIFDDEVSQAPDDELFHSAFLSVKDTSPKDPEQLFDQILDNNEGPKVTIEAKDKQASNLDHAKIISEVLKRYPHLVKSNKNIKLKILNSPAKGKKTRQPNVLGEQLKEKEMKAEGENVSFTYETDVLDSKEAAKLISLGAENIKGPWICLICGTPGRALNFTSYYNFRRHLVDIHKEKPVSTICEHCGLKSYKRNYLLYHIYTKHGVPPPAQYHFPKCNMCDYVALTEGFLVKHKLTHNEAKTFDVSVRCKVCSQKFNSSNELFFHAQKTGHKNLNALLSDKKPSIQCNYCMKVFLRDNNFYCHLKTAHKEQALRDGLIDHSDDDDDKLLDESSRVVQEMKPIVKHELTNFESKLDTEEVPIEYDVSKRQDISTHVGKKLRVPANLNQKILNSNYSTQAVKQTRKAMVVSDVGSEFVQQIDSSSQSTESNIVVINDIEYIMKGNQLIPRKPISKQSTNEEYILSDYIPEEDNSQRLQNTESVAIATSLHGEINNIHSSEIVEQPKMLLKKPATLNQPIQIVVSNEEEYKALMASNHSIIFDDGDPSKTLTVLTAPQNTALDSTGIDLDNTQSNDMMIIQEDYPLNVSEAVSGDNSKYVVVYSHAMDHDDPNKQYQIITPQEIGAQFVQNSAVITQNYDSITTSTSVLTANVIGTQIEQQWPQASQHNVDSQNEVLHNEVAPESELQAMNAEHEQANIKQNDDDNNMSDLPETEILRIPSKSTLIQLQEQCNISRSNSVNIETLTNITPKHLIVEDNQPTTIQEPMDIEIPTEPIPEKEVTSVDETQMSGVHEIETESQNEINIQNIAEESSEVTELTEQEPLEVPLSVQEHTEPSLLVQEQHDVSVHDPLPLPLENTESIEEANLIVNENVTAENVEPNTSNIIEENIHTQEEAAIEEVPMQTEKVIPSDVIETREQIQNLASEWSEDEYENVLEESESSENKITSVHKIPITEEPELEESIENIQQEVQKQISGSELDAEEESLASQKEDDIPNTEKPNIVPINTEATQVKISTLLNDWEDNDSQEENTSINENGDDNNPSIHESDETKTDEQVIINQNETIQAPVEEAKKSDNIKSLVSDWDDDEDESK